MRHAVFHRGGRSSARAGGWVMIDALIGLLLVSVAAGILISSWARVSKARARLGELRRDTALLEASAVAADPRTAAGLALPPGATRERIGAGWWRLRLGRAELLVRLESQP